MACSFAPDGRWFVFDIETSSTLAKGFSGRRTAERWIGRELGFVPPEKGNHR